MTFHERVFAQDALLPPSATSLELAAAGSMARLSEIPVPVPELWNPQSCPIKLLPWLAWALSVDIWDEDWPEQKKRLVVAESIKLHRLKGTLSGIRRYVELAGGKVIRYVRPPATAFAGRSTTLEEHLAYLERMPQIRIYKYRERGASVVRGKFPGRRNFIGYQMPRQSDAYLRTGHRVFYWDKGTYPLASGIEREIRAAEEYGARLLMLPGRKPARAAYPNAILHKSHPVKSTAAARYYATTLTRASEDAGVQRLLKTATPGMTPIDLNARSVAETGTALSGSVFAGRPLHGAMLPQTRSGERLYDVLYLHDSQRADRNRKGRVFCGHQRLGIKPFTAELTISVRNKKPVKAMFARGFVGQMPHKSDQRALTTIFRSVVSAKSFRDKLLIDTQTTRHQRLSDGVPLDGTRSFGDRVKA